MTLSVNTSKGRLRMVVATIAVVAGLACIMVILLKEDTSTPDQPTVNDTASTVESSSLRGATLYVDPNSNAARQAAEWRVSRPQDAALMSKLAALPTAYWLTDSVSLGDGLNKYLAAADASKTMPLLVVYAIPSRDCGLYSAGGAQDIESYRGFIDTLAMAIGTKEATIIVEPDAVAAIENQDCLDGKQLAERYEALSYASEQLGRLPATSVYIDAGNSAWTADNDKLAERMKKAGIEFADGFSLNVSNFQTTADTTEYGKKISSLLGGAHFVIDTSRNGVGPYENPKYKDFNWCNPPDRALGHYPTTNTGEKLVDAYLYIKTAGESDGQDANFDKCHGGPKAGVWWPEYALGLIKRWPANLQPPAN